MVARCRRGPYAGFAASRLNAVSPSTGPGTSIRKTYCGPAVSISQASSAIETIVIRKADAVGDRQRRADEAGRGEAGVEGGELRRVAGDDHTPEQQEGEEERHGRQERERRDEAAQAGRRQLNVGNARAADPPRKKPPTVQPRKPVAIAAKLHTGTVAPSLPRRAASSTGRNA